MKTLQTLIGAWSAKTFPASTPASKLAHLKREVEELGEQLAGPPREALPFFPSRREAWVHRIGEELADCAILLLDVAEFYGIDLEKAVTATLAKNFGRAWGEPDARGVVEHVRESAKGIGDEL